MKGLYTVFLITALVHWSMAAELPEDLSKYIEDELEKRSGCGVTEADKTIILDTHNRLRRDVSPSSANMMKMYWNDDLAASAQKWAENCWSAHDTNEDRQIPGTGKNMVIGQSWASGGIFPDWRSAIEDGWYSEVESFSYGSQWQRGVVGHYTQVVRDEANLVGCGKCSCPQGPLYICNYYRGNARDTGRPYQKGSKCANCKTCVDGLCDCGSILCKNNGTLNSQTCKCDCQGKWGGPDCFEYQCPPQDGDGCGKWFFESGCTQYYNVPDECPHMCGLC